MLSVTQKSQLHLLWLDVSDCLAQIAGQADACNHWQTTYGVQLAMESAVLEIMTAQDEARRAGKYPAGNLRGVDLVNAVKALTHDDTITIRIWPDRQFDTSEDYDNVDEFFTAYTDPSDDFLVLQVPAHWDHETLTTLANEVNEAPAEEGK